MTGRLGLSTEVVNDKRDTYLNWGIAPTPALWPGVLRILFVIDGRISTSLDPGVFGLGYVLQTLRDNSYAWWVQYQVQVVRRNQATLMPPSPDFPDSNYTVGNTPPFEIINFRFTQGNFNIDDWDQVWLFGDYPANMPGDIRDRCFCPLEDDEVRLLAEWMDRGGGVFAAGDHYNLGASMCSRVPRVRTMRKWTVEQGVPPQYGNARNETLQHSSGYEDLWERDTIPQPIEVVQKPRLIDGLFPEWYPHALMDTPNGVITTFPDHMHEGQVIDDDQVQLDNPLNIPGYDKPEYPVATPVNFPGAAARTGPGGLYQFRPVPHVVAYGRTTNPIYGDGVILARAAQPITSAVTRTFALVGSYDGDSVGLGRVVVDSTWHHWFSYNLHGFANDGPDIYFQRMQYYYRNIGVWLATPAQRQAMFAAASWGLVVSDPMAFPAATSQSLWAAGRRAQGMLAWTVSPAMLLEFVSSFFGGWSEQVFGLAPDFDPAAPYFSTVTTGLAVRAVLGGITSSLKQPALDYLMKAGGRRLLDAGAILRYAGEGVRQGQSALLDALKASAVGTKDVIGRLAEAFRPAEQVPIAVDLVGLRVVADKMQFPDPTDPALAGSGRGKGKRGRARPTMMLRVAINGSVIAQKMIRIEVPPFRAEGAMIDLDEVLYDGVIQSGESLTVEAVAAGEGDEGERVRFTDTMTGNPLNWAGSHAPSRQQAWRLWYRMEKVRKRLTAQEGGRGRRG
jgi:hypothetical protein